MHLSFPLPPPSRELVRRSQVNLSAPLGLCAHLCPSIYDEIVKVFASTSNSLTIYNTELIFLTVGSIYDLYYMSNA